MKTKKQSRFIHIVYVWIFSLMSFTMAGPGAPIKVYIEDSHAGSFYFFASELDLDIGYKLLLIDQHSDASMVLCSDRLRDTIRYYRSNNKLVEKFFQWRNSGMIQCFDWIEPLMPRPFSEVIWTSYDTISDKEKQNRTSEIKKQINGFNEIRERKTGDLSSIFKVIDLRKLLPVTDLQTPVVASLDLDFVARYPDSVAIKKLHDAFDYVLSLPTLKALSISISRPYLISDAQASLLLTETFKILFSLEHVEILFEPLISPGPDRSLLALSSYKNKKRVSYFDITTISATLKNLLIQNKTILTVNQKKEEWKNLLTTWEKQIYLHPHIGVAIDGKRGDESSCYNIKKNNAFSIEISNPERLPHNAVIHWNILAPSNNRYNIIDQRFSFGKHAPTVIRYISREMMGQANRIRIPCTVLDTFFDPRTGLGTIHVDVTVENNGIHYFSNRICISKYLNDTYPGVLTQIFNLPYVFGSALLQKNGSRGAEVRIGADCSNFLIYGLRQTGKMIPYGNAKQLASHLKALDTIKNFSKVTSIIHLTDELISKGLFLYFGAHIAAVYEDMEPKGVLDRSDLIVHQLEDVPEIIPLGSLTQTSKPFLLMSLP